MLSNIRHRHIQENMSVDMVLKYYIQNYIFVIFQILSIAECVGLREVSRLINQLVYFYTLELTEMRPSFSLMCQKLQTFPAMLVIEMNKII